MKMNWKPLHTDISVVPPEDGTPAWRVIKTGKLDVFDENSCVLLEGTDFHNGTISVELKSRLLPDAPDFARGFAGIVFRSRPDGSEFECYYLRPANGNHPDPVRRSHASQYFSYPGYTFSWFREFGIEGYEAPADISLDAWIRLKIEVQDETARFFVNDETAPVLVVNDLRHGPDARGLAGFFVDTGTEAFFRDLRITCTD